MTAARNQQDWECVARWLREDNSADDGPVLAHLMRLTGEQLAHDTPEPDKGPVQKQVEDLLNESVIEAIELIVKARQHWRQKGRSKDVKGFETRCVDQLAALLLFRHLNPAERGAMPDPVFQTLLKRVAFRVLALPLLGKTGSIAHRDDLLQELTQAWQCKLLEVAPRFRYKGFPRARAFFNKHRPRILASCLPQGWTNELGKKSGVPLRGCRGLYRVAKAVEPHWSPSRCRDFQSWVDRLGRDDAIKCAILVLLHERDEKEWKDIAALVREERCGLNESDLPPGVTWAEAAAVFANKPSSDTLKQFFSRRMRKHRRIVLERLENLLGPDDAIRYWTLCAFRAGDVEAWATIRQYLGQAPCPSSVRPYLPPIKWARARELFSRDGFLIDEAALSRFFHETHARLRSYSG